MYVYIYVSLSWLSLSYHHKEYMYIYIIYHKSLWWPSLSYHHKKPMLLTFSYQKPYDGNFSTKFLNKNPASERAKAASRAASRGPSRTLRRFSGSGAMALKALFTNIILGVPYIITIVYHTPKTLLKLLSSRIPRLSRHLPSDFGPSPAVLTSARDLRQGVYGLWYKSCITHNREYTINPIV